MAHFLRLMTLLPLLLALGAHAERDPTAPPGGQPGAPQGVPSAASALRLQQVNWGRPLRVAINGRWLGIGDQIEGWTVQRIEPDAVLLQGPGGRARLTLFGSRPQVVAERE